MVLVLAACKDGTPIVLTSEAVVSPGAESVAIIELIDNGLGFGQGYAYNEIHVGGRGLEVSNHLQGNSDPSVAFIAPWEGDESARPSIQWMDDRNLVVTFGPNIKPIKQGQRVGGVFISYVSRGIGTGG